MPLNIKKESKNIFHHVFLLSFFHLSTTFEPGRISLRENHLSIIYYSGLSTIILTNLTVTSTALILV